MSFRLSATFVLNTELAHSRSLCYPSIPSHPQPYFVTFSFPISFPISSIMVAFVSALAPLPVAHASAFHGARFVQRQAHVTTARFSMIASKAVPFLPQPAKLDGSLPGDVGFDPLGFSDMWDINFLREAEVKHGMYICSYFISPFNAFWNC